MNKTITEPNRAERKQIENLKEKVYNDFETIRCLLAKEAKENLNKAETLLQQVEPTLCEIKDDAIKADFERYKSQIASIKERIRQREETIKEILKKNERHRRAAHRFSRLRNGPLEDDEEEDIYVIHPIYFDELTSEDEEDVPQM